MYSFQVEKQQEQRDQGPLACPTVARDDRAKSEREGMARYLFHAHARVSCASRDLGSHSRNSSAKLSRKSSGPRCRAAYRGQKRGGGFSMGEGPPTDAAWMEMWASSSEIVWYVVERPQ